MAIKISSRKPTQISYKGTTGGSLGWINQAGASGRAALNLGSQITRTALQLQDAFDDEMDQSEIRQQVQDMRSGLSKMSRKWNEARYDPEFLGNNEKGFWQKREESLWKPAWEELTAGKDPKAVSEFGVLFNDLYNAAYEDAGSFGRKQRWSRLVAKDQTSYDSFMDTIKTSPSVQQKLEAYDGIKSMYEEGLSGSVAHRDISKWTKLNDTAKKDLDFFSAYENALGGLGLEVNPNNMETGYTSAHYEQAIININNNETIAEPDRKKLRQFFKDNLALRLKSEKRQKDIGIESLEKQLSTKFIAGQLTIQDVQAVSNGLPAGRDMYWFNQLKEKGVYHWTPIYNALKKKIQSGTFEKINDVTKNPHEIQAVVRAAAGDMPADEVDKLIAAIDKKSKNSELSLAMNAAVKHAKRVFDGPLGPLAKLQGTSGNIDLNKRMAASEDKVTKFDQQLEVMLEEGERAGKTWMSMLDFNSPDYIVDTLIDSINGTMPEEKDDDFTVLTAVQQADPAEETGFWADVKDWWGGDDATAGEVYDEEGNKVESGRDQVIFEVYGRKSNFPPTINGKPTTYEFVKAVTDSNHAEMWHGNAAKRIQFPIDHPGYNQYPNGTETPTAWRARMKLLGLD